jgi:hypothetical protein
MQPGMQCNLKWPISLLKLKSCNVCEEIEFNLFMALNSISQVTSQWQVAPLLQPTPNLMANRAFGSSPMPAHRAQALA